ncbi:MAG: PIG-L family deacetylase, partial [Cytophagales bacterium]
MKHIYLIFGIKLVLLFNTFVFAQTSPKLLNTGEILNEIKKLQVLGTVLYLAAHPDDENTAVIAYLANERKVRTGYLSLTRGDGGQNLIGVEQSELLGLIRTQELLQARRIDGGEQFFTRANDFGFSKNAQETFSIWNKKELLKDVVRIIRHFKPDVIITRFPPNREAGHGHHEASTLLALEAFELANDETYEPSLGKKHQITRLVWNEYSRGFRNTTNDSTRSFSTEISNFNYLLGKSNLIIAAESRSMHKSQGFGTGKNYGNRIDWF